MPATITSVLEDIFDDAIVPALENAFPILAAIQKIPVVGDIETDGIDDLGNWLIANGVIEVKVGLLNILTTASQQKWAAEIAIIRAVTKGGLTATQQEKYDADLQALVNARGGIVNA